MRRKSAGSLRFGVGISRRRVRRIVMRRIATVLIVSGLLAAPLSAQFRGNARVEMPPTPRQSVYVRDSAVAAEKLALAQRMERLKEWNKSADVYQEIVEKYADRVVPADESNEPGGPQRYSSVTLKVQTLLGKWSEEGLAVYRTRYGNLAATMLEGAEPDDIATLNRVVQRYFPTEAAKTAALRLMELYLENGE